MGNISILYMYLKHISTYRPKVILVIKIHTFNRFKTIKNHIYSQLEAIQPCSLFFSTKLNIIMIISSTVLHLLR